MGDLPERLRDLAASRTVDFSGYVALSDAADRLEVLEEIRKQFWKLFDDWVAAEDMVLQDRGVGDDFRQFAAEVEERRRRLSLLWPEDMSSDD